MIHCVNKDTLCIDTSKEERFISQVHCENGNGVERDKHGALKFHLSSASSFSDFQVSYDERDDCSSSRICRRGASSYSTAPSKQRVPLMSDGSPPQDTSIQMDVSDMFKVSDTRERYHIVRHILN